MSSPHTAPRRRRANRRGSRRASLAYHHAPRPRPVSLLGARRAVASRAPIVLRWIALALALASAACSIWLLLNPPVGWIVLGLLAWTAVACVNVAREIEDE